MWMADLKRKLEDVLDKVDEESKKKGITIEFQEGKSYGLQQEKKAKMRVTNWRYKHPDGAEVQMSETCFNRVWKMQSPNRHWIRKRSISKAK